MRLPPGIDNERYLRWMEADKRYRDGETMVAIAKDHDVSLTTVRRWILTFRGRIARMIKHKNPCVIWMIK